MQGNVSSRRPSDSEGLVPALRLAGRALESRLEMYSHGHVMECNALVAYAALTETLSLT